MDATDARKAGNESDTTRRIPRPPALTGRLAWVHWGSETARLVIVQRPLLRRLSNCSIASLPKHGGHYLRCTEGRFQKGEGVVCRPADGSAQFAALRVESVVDIIIIIILLLLLFAFISRYLHSSR